MRQKVFFQRLRICLFTVTLGVGFILGLILPLRPAVSESEGRELTHFPRVTLASLLSGEFTAGISQWYADTYPCREELMGASHTLKGFTYGVTFTDSGTDSTDTHAKTCTDCLSGDNQSFTHNKIPPKCCI